MVVNAVAGDIDDDAHEEIMAMYDYGLQSNGKYKTVIHGWRYNGSALTYLGSSGLWNSATANEDYNARNVTQALSYDLNQDGKAEYVDVYDYGIQSNGKYKTAIHGWTSSGNALAYLGTGGLWNIVGYNARCVVASDACFFNSDGLPDVSLAYRYDVNTTALHMFLGRAGNSLSYQGSAGWWRGAMDSLMCFTANYLNEDAPGELPKQVPESDAPALPSTFTLSQNYPNPFNPSTTIAYNLSVDGQVTLEIINMLGQIVTTLVDENQSAGEHQVIWNAGTNDCASGMYFYKLKVGDFSTTKKMLLVK
jgi:hypothetical protein